MLGEMAYQNALKRREQLQREIERNRRDLDEVESFLRLCDRYASLDSELPLSMPAVTNERAAPVEPVLTPLSGMDLLPHVRKAILEIGKPLVRGEIVRALADRGFRVAGENQARNVGTIMWRAKMERGEFESFDKLGYWPADVPYPPVGYEPPHHDEVDEEEEPERVANSSTQYEAWEKAAKSA